MANILVRSGKNPLQVVSPEASMAWTARGLFGSNTGNLFFWTSVHRMLSTPGTRVVSDSRSTERSRPDQEHIERINSEFDMFVIPLANSFRAGFIPHMNRLTSVIERLDIPVVVIGVGAQLLPGRTVDSVPADVQDASRRFVAAVLDHSASIGVRGAITRNYLQHLGFPADSIDVIGCPSLYLRGADLNVTKKIPHLQQDSRIALNVTPSKTAFAAMIERSVAHHPQLTYIPQEYTDLQMMMWGIDRDTNTDPRMPTHTKHPLFVHNRMRAFVDATTWIDYLRDHHFVFGSRLHGNLAALLAETPAYVVAHDSRTLELAEYHGIPHRTLGDLGDATAADLYEEADYDAFNARHRETFANYRDFLDRNKVPHIFRTDDSKAGSAPDFDRALTARQFPPAIEVLGGTDPAAAAIRDRLAWLRQGPHVDQHRSVGGFVPEFAPDTGRDDAGVPLAVQVQRLTRDVARLRSELDRLKQRRSVLQRILGKARRTLQRKDALNLVADAPPTGR